MNKTIAHIRDFFTYRLSRLSYYLTRTILGKISDNTLFCIIDLNKTSESFDISFFYAYFEIERIKRGLAHIHILIIPAEPEALEKRSIKYKSFINFDGIKWRTHNIVEQLSRILPSCTGTTLCSNKGHANKYKFFCEHIVYALPIREIYKYVHQELTLLGSNWQIFTAPNQANAYVKIWIDSHIKDKKLIVMTMRQSDFEPIRNNKLSDWIEFAHIIKNKGYFPLIVADTDKDLEDYSVFQGIEVFSPACWNIEMRAAIYEAAYLNLAVNNGTNSLKILNHKCRYIVYKFTTSDNNNFATQDHIYKTIGLRWGESFNFSHKHQKFVWEDDSLDTLIKEFDEMVEIIETEK